MNVAEHLHSTCLVCSHCCSGQCPWHVCLCQRGMFTDLSSKSLLFFHVCAFCRGWPNRDCHRHDDKFERRVHTETKTPPTHAHTGMHLSVLNMYAQVQVNVTETPHYTIRHHSIISIVYTISIKGLQLPIARYCKISHDGIHSAWSSHPSWPVNQSEVACLLIMSWTWIMRCLFVLKGISFGVLLTSVWAHGMGILLSPS